MYPTSPIILFLIDSILLVSVFLGISFCVSAVLSVRFTPSSLAIDLLIDTIILSDINLSISDNSGFVPSVKLDKNVFIFLFNNSSSISKLFFLRLSLT